MFRRKMGKEKGKVTVYVTLQSLIYLIEIIFQLGISCMFPYAITYSFYVFSGFR